MSLTRLYIIIILSIMVRVSKCLNQDYWCVSPYGGVVMLLPLRMLINFISHLGILISSSCGILLVVVHVTCINFGMVLYFCFGVFVVNYVISFLYSGLNFIFVYIICTLGITRILFREWLYSSSQKKKKYLKTHYYF